MTLINTCRERNSAGTHIIAQPPLPITQELLDVTFFPTRRENPPIELLLEGLADGTSGFAVFLRDWARHLAKYGVRVFIPPHIKSEYPEIVKMHDTKVTNPIQLIIIPGGGFPAKNPDRYTIGYTLFETNEFPVHFKNSAENLDSIWTGSNFCYERFVKVGIPKEKIEVFPVGVDTELFSPYASPLLKSEKKFVFGNVCGWSERKGISVLLNAFLKEFNRSEDVTLAILGGWYAKDNAMREIEEVKKNITGKANFPEIILDWNNRSDFEMPGVYTSFDALCYPSKGEGYCKPIVESLSCSVPVIATDAPPMNEIVTKEYGYPIDVEKVAPEPRADWICDFYKGADFFHPSEEHLRNIMREVFTHSEEAKAKAELGREEVKRNHNTAFVIDKVIKRLRDIRMSK